MPTIKVRDARIYYEQHGSGPPLLLLHAGWGRAVNGFELQVARLGDRFQMIIPDRRGYGRSSRVETLPADYHREAAEDMLAVLDAAGIEAAHLWGHSDGAVVGAWMAIEAPERVRSIVFEGGHLLTRKEGKASSAFMQRVRERPETLPADIQEALATAHGADYWQRLLWLWTEAWLELYPRSGDLYDGRLEEIHCPTLVMHGGQDPHTSLEEIGSLAAQIPGAKTLLIPEAGHSLHDDADLLERVHAAVVDLIGA
jgi:pimeloyl-ACP methyl ester carboxylesterase